MPRINEANKTAPKTTTASAQDLATAFDKSFPYSNDAGNLTKLPASMDGAKLPGEAGKIFAEIQKDGNHYDHLNAYQVSVGGEKLFAITGHNGTPPSDFGLALFNSRGKQLAFKDVLGLNQWQFDGKGQNFILSEGLPHSPHATPAKPLPAETKKITDAFDAKFKWNDKTDSLDIPNEKFEGALPKDTAATHMANSSTYDYTEKYKVNVDGKNLFLVVGVADDVYDVGLFHLDGSKVAFNQGANAGEWTL
jgi:hypothetical protein